MSESASGKVTDRSIADLALRRVSVQRVDFRGGEVANSRFRGIDLYHLDISGDLFDVVINGVDVAPLIEAELNRRMPERAKMKPDDPGGFREGWAILERRWGETMARAKALPESTLNESVDDEWSFIQTLRHLNFATAAWVNRMILGDLWPWHPLDLPWDEAPGWEGIPGDRDSRPSLEAVLAVRHERQATVRGVLDDLTDEQLSSTVSRPEPGWPAVDDFPVKECLSIVLNEEWHHRLFAERDLDKVTAAG